MAVFEASLLRDHPADSIALQSFVGVPTLIEAQARRTPAAIAVVCGDGHLTYHQLDERARCLAAELIALGAGPESLIGLFFERSLEMVVALLAIHKAGAAYVPLDPAYPPDRLAFMCADAQIAVLVSTASLANCLPAQRAQIVLVDSLRAAAEPASPTRHRDPPRAAPTLAQQAAYVIYTSGSTGRPKGVVVSHGSLWNHNLAIIREYGLHAGDRVLQFASISFDVAVEEIFPTLVCGATLVLRAEVALSATATFLKWLGDQRITVLNLPTAFWQTLTAELKTDALTLPACVRLVVVGGEKVSAASYAAWRKTVGAGVRWLNGYGPTETTVTTTLFEPSQAAELGDANGGLPIGHPIGGAQIRILNTRQTPVAVGEAGELCITGPGLARAYLKRPDLTAEKFVPDPTAAEPGARLYRTGDLGRCRPDGVLEFLGRLDQQVKIRGFRVEPGEIESVLARHPAVQAVAIDPQEVEPGDVRLVAWVVANSPVAPTIAELRSWCQRTLPDYMLPGAFRFLPALPLGPNGKVNRKALPPVDWAAARADRPYRAPRSVTEATLATLWQEILGLSRIGAEDNFFELGGHSLLAARVLSRLQRTLGAELSLRDFFEAPTLAELARRVDSLARGQRDTVAPAPRQLGRASLPLSFAQQRLWFLDQLDRGNAGYVLPAPFQLTGPLDPQALEHSLQTIVQRHEMLRTVFPSENGQPVQVIQPAVRIGIDFEDLRQAPNPEQALVQRIRAESQHAFDLAQGPLLRATLFQMETERHVLLLLIHHIVADGWSLVLLVDELATLYAAFVMGQPSPLPPLALQYADYALWQRAWLEDGRLDRQLDYWRGRLGVGITPLELPTDYRRPAVQSYHGASYVFTLPIELQSRLNAFSRAAGVTLYMTLLAGFQCLLHRYCGQPDIIVGSPIATRPRAEFEKLIGFFTNTLVLRTDFSGNPTVRELLERVREAALGAYEHQDVPFERLVEALQPKRDLSHHPLFQVLFVLQSVPVEEVDFARLKLQYLDVDSGVTPFDLVLSMEETRSGLRGVVQYRTDLFETATIQRLAGHLLQLLTGMVDHPERSVLALPLLTPAERKQLLLDWNRTTVASDPEIGAQHLFERQAERTPEAIAAESEGQRLTYRELDQQSSRLARHLRQLGVGPEVLVGLCVERSLGMVVGMLGILKAGGAYVPLDPSYPAERLAFMIADSQLSVLITQSDLLERLRSPGGTNTAETPLFRGPGSPRSGLPSATAEGLDLVFQLARLSVVCLDVFDRAVPDHSDLPLNPSRAFNSELPAYVIYTSGSTGTPKGVVVRQRALVNFLYSFARQPGLDAHDTLLGVTTLSFDIAGLEIFLPLTVGARLVLASRDVAADGRRLRELLAASGATVMQATPVTWRLLLEGEWPGGPLKALAGGEAMPAELAGELLSRGVELWNVYGPTETTIWSTVHRVTQAQSPVPIGRPIANTTAYIVDSQWQPVPIGVPGMLYLGGEGLARGYLAQPGLTADKFVPDPFSPIGGQRLYRTGDRARYRTDGTIDFLGRDDHQVKIRGFRIELDEIESVLGRCPGVKQAVVAAPVGPEGEKRLVAYVVKNAPGSVSVASLRSWLRGRLPEFMVPGACVFLEQFPLTPNGKINRGALPAPANERPDLEKEFEAPRTPLEDLVAGLWAEVLGIEQIGVQDNFFELGGHSLLATQVISRVRTTLGVDLPLRVMFESPTVAGLAERLTVARRVPAQSPIAVLQATAPVGPIPLSSAQQRLWFFDQLEPGSSSYNLPMALRLRGPLKFTVAEQCLREIVRRHAILRTTFTSVQNQPVQVVHGTSALDVELHDLTVCPAAERATALKRQMLAVAGRAFDLVQGPLIRAHLLRVEPDDHVLLVVMHHVVADGWSLEVLVHEWTTLYHAFSQGQPSPLPDLGIQYADFAVWQREWLRGTALDQQLAYWRAALAGPLPALELPTDHRRPPTPAGPGAVATLQLSPERLRALGQLSRREHVTLYMTLLAVFKVLLHRYTGQTDIVIGSMIANRNQEAVEDLIGFFANTLVLRSDLAGDPTFRELLGRVRAVVLGASEHQNLPFERLVEDLRPERSLSHSPLFQVMFILQNAPRRPRAVPGLQLEYLEVDSELAKFDLSFAFAETPEGLTGSLEYRTDLFEAGTIRRLLGHYERLLESVLTGADQRISQLSMLQPEEVRQLTVEWNATTADYRRAGGIQQLIEDQASRTPHAAAVICGAQTLTYEELNQHANQLARDLTRHGAKPETVVGLYFERSVDLVVGILGILKTGAAWLALDPAYPRERLAQMLEQSCSSLLLIQETLRAQLPPHQAEVVGLQPVGGREVVPNPPCASLPEQIAYLIFTSGSTGKPKGVMITHANLIQYVQAMAGQLPVRAGTRYLHTASFSFSSSVRQLMLPLSQGATVVVATQDQIRDPVALFGEIHRQGVTVMDIVPAYWRSCLETLATLSRTRCADLLQNDLALILSASEPLPAEVPRAWERLHPARLINMFGQTETTGIVSLFPVQPDTLDPAGVVPLGQPIRNTQLFVLDNHLQPVPVGIPGELFIGGAGLGRGYLGQPDLTAERFVPNPFGEQPGDRLYRTGDLVCHRPEGTLAFVGRRDNQVKIRGFRVEPSEIEFLLRQHPAVKECLVVAGREANGQMRLIAYLAVGDQPAPPLADLRALLNQRLPDYMVPSVFVPVAKLPRTPNGKIDRRALPPPIAPEEESKHRYQPPASPIEQVVAEVWAELLGRDRISRQDNFFELGGHSLLATQLVARLNRIFRVQLPLRTLFESPRLASLAEEFIRLEAKPNQTEHIARLYLKIQQMSREERSKTLKNLAAPKTPQSIGTPALGAPRPMSDPP